MARLRVQRIVCDNPDCVMYVDELVREEGPGDEVELVEHVRSLTIGWTRIGDSDFCPDHPATGAGT